MRAVFKLSPAQRRNYANRSGLELEEQEEEEGRRLAMLGGVVGQLQETHAIFSVRSPKVKATKNSTVRFCVSVEVFKLLPGIDSKPLTGPHTEPTTSLFRGSMLGIIPSGEAWPGSVLCGAHFGGHLSRLMTNSVYILPHALTLGQWSDLASD